MPVIYLQCRVTDFLFISHAASALFWTHPILDLVYHCSFLFPNEGGEGWCFVLWLYSSQEYEIGRVTDYEMVWGKKFLHG